MQKNPSRKAVNLSFLWGIKAGFYMILLTLLLYFVTGSGYRPVPVWNHFLLLFIMFIAINSLKKKVYKGYLSFKQCYISGLIIGIVVAFIFGIYMFIHTSFIDKQLIINNIAANEKALSQYLAGTELQNKISLLKENTTSFSIALKATIELILISIFLPLLVSIFLKKEHNSRSGKMEVVEIE